MVRRVVKVGNSPDVTRLAERSREIAEVVHVSAHLGGRMRDRAASVSRDRDEFVVTFEALRVRPLLQLDHDVCRLPRGPPHSSEHDIGTLARQRQLELDKHLHTVEARLVKVGRQHRDAATPRSPLSRRWGVPGRELHLFGQTLRKTCLEG